ncbi:hypothetical protein BGZ99_009773 [Dissophora globulifera]|uniref:Uncharacterized protein n=1 Tax=Dissophora globulifera TaxID=979702 RepID=A0A9P6R413_9FUNG|nr:hypothetical protein BGZ99_009773 [Dissophora globulifera]
MKAPQFYFLKGTHAGCHTGTPETFHLELNFEHDKRLGCLCMTQSESRYVPRKPTADAFYMVHLAKLDDPFMTKRDLVTPPLLFQRLIFSWIKNIFKDDITEKTGRNQNLNMDSTTKSTKEKAIAKVINEDLIRPHRLLGVARGVALSRSQLLV